MKTVLVTGAAKGIGAQIVKDFLEDGYNVCLNYKTSEREAKEILKEAKLNKQNLMIYKADVTNTNQVETMISDIISNYGKIDILVNNAGISEYKQFTDITNEDFKQMIDTSILGTFNITKEVISKSMLKNKSGVIINISSIWGITGASCEVHYSTVKSAIIGMTKSLAKEYGPSNIRANVVAPGIIKTDMIKDFTSEELFEMQNEIPLNRIGTPKDISGVVKFLASEEASYITGQIISPNGGIII